MIVLTKVRIPRGCTLHIAQSGVGLHSDYIIDFKNRKRQREVKQCKGGEVFFKYVLYAPPPFVWNPCHLSYTYSSNTQSCSSDSLRPIEKHLKLIQTDWKRHGASDAIIRPFTITYTWYTWHLPVCFNFIHPRLYISVLNLCRISTLWRVQF